MTSPFNTHSFLYTFFSANDCQIVNHVPGKLTVKLTEKMDQAIMNRPFYWHYMKTTGRRGNPLELTFITDISKDIENGEWIHIGTPKMNEIIEFLEKESTCIQMFELHDTKTRVMLQPWLLINFSLIFKGGQMKESIISLAINLINGIVLKDAMEQLQRIKLSSVISNNCYTISPLISLQNGCKRLESIVVNQLTSRHAS